MKTKIIDTTLRDGEQKHGIALGISKKVEIACKLNEMGIYQLEVGVPAMEGEEKESIKIINSMKLNCRVSSWNRMNLSDIEHSLECGIQIIHISVPVSDLLIREKFHKSRMFILKELDKCLRWVQHNKVCCSIGLEDASRADMEFLKYIFDLADNYNVYMIRYADTIGKHNRQEVRSRINHLKEYSHIEIGFHGHNDLGMAISNSLAAVMSGATFIDCTVGGVGERAGNCDLVKFAEIVSEECDLYEVYQKDLWQKKSREIRRLLYD